MKYSRMRVGLFFGSAAVVVLGLGVVAVTPAVAANRSVTTGAVTGRASPSTVPAAGIYNYTDGGIITEGGAATTITINSNGTFTLLYASITDTGVWIQEGKTIALTVTSGEDGSAGCLLLGTVERKGINSASKQGQIDCMVPFGKTGSWWATVPHHVR
jgi:hypothetical protein